MAYKNFIHKDRLAADRISSSSTLSGGLGSISRAGRRVVPQLPPSGLANYPFSDINISFDTVGAYSGTGVSVSELLARNERTLASTMVNPYDAIIVEEVCELKLLVSVSVGTCISLQSRLISPPTVAWISSTRQMLS